MLSHVFGMQICKTFTDGLVTSNTMSGGETMFKRFQKLPGAFNKVDIVNVPQYFADSFGLQRTPPTRTGTALPGLNKCYFVIIRKHNLASLWAVGAVPALNWRQQGHCHYAVH